MADKVIINKSILTGIGNAIREKKGTTELIPSLNMESEIRSILTASGEDMLQQLVNAQGNCNHLFYGIQISDFSFANNLDISKVTELRYMFANTYVVTVPNFDTKHITHMGGMFMNTDYLEDGPILDTSSVKYMQNMFDTSRNLKNLPLYNTSQVVNMENTFRKCPQLTTIPAYDVSNVTNLYAVFNGCSKLKSILMYGMKVSFDISSSTKFEQSDLVTILNNLATVTTTQTLTIGSTNLAKLTDEDKAIATNKGWTLA